MEEDRAAVDSEDRVEVDLVGRMAADSEVRTEDRRAVALAARITDGTDRPRQGAVAWDA